MKVSLRWSGALAAALLAGSAAPAPAQLTAFPTAPQILGAELNPGNPAAQAVANAANVAALGAAGMGGAAGNFAPLAAAITAPAALPANRGANPYALSTAPRFNPYLNFAARLGASASLAGLGSGYAAGLGASPYLTGLGYGGYDYGPGLAGPGMGYGYALQGLASYTSSAGRYWLDTEQARITREQSRQAFLETQRRRIQFEQWADSVR